METTNAEGKPAVRSDRLLEELEAALRHTQNAMVFCNGRSDTVFLVTHKAELELKKAIDGERQYSSNAGSELPR